MSLCLTLVDLSFSRYQRRLPALLSSFHGICVTARLSALRKRPLEFLASFPSEVALHSTFSVIVDRPTMLTHSEGKKALDYILRVLYQLEDNEYLPLAVSQGDLCIHTLMRMSDVELEELPYVDDQGNEKVLSMGGRSKLESVRAFCAFWIEQKEPIGESWESITVDEF